MRNLSPETINLITNVLAALLVILEPIKAYFQSQPFNWITFAICLMSAIVAWFTGKSTLYAMKKGWIKKA